jgi:hypothetical protein
MRLQVKGSASAQIWGTADPLAATTGGAILRVTGPGGYYGQWVSQTHWNIVDNPVNEGVFAGVNADAIDGIFTGPVFTMATGVPQTIAVGMQLRPYAHLWPSPTAAAVTTMDFGSNQNRIGYPMQSTVFELPAGCTCSSQQARVVDNTYCGPSGDCPTPTRPATWGSVKTLYR